MEIQLHKILTKLNYSTISLHRYLHLKMTLTFQSVIKHILDENNVLDDITLLPDSIL